MYDGTTPLAKSKALIVLRSLRHTRSWGILMNIRAGIVTRSGWIEDLNPFYFNKTVSAGWYVQLLFSSIRLQYATAPSGRLMSLYSGQSTQTPALYQSWARMNNGFLSAPSFKAHPQKT